MNTRTCVLGLGNMGRALAETLLKTNGALIVWNRTSSKASALVAAGAQLARGPADAIQNSDIAIVCVGTYDDTREMLTNCGDLSGKTLVQLSTGTREQAESLQQWAEARGAQYLDGVIIGYPSDIGRRDALLLVAGLEPAWNVCSKALLQLGGASRYVGTNLEAPIALEFALTGAALMLIMGAIYGARAVEKAGVDLGLLSELIPGVAPFLIKSVQRQVDAIVQNRFTEPEAMLGTWQAGIAQFPEAQDTDIDLLRPVKEVLRRAVDAGYAGEEIAAAIKILRAPK